MPDIYGNLTPEEQAQGFQGQDISTPREPVPSEAAAKAWTPEFANASPTPIDQEEIAGEVENLNAQYGTSSANTLPLATIGGQLVEAKQANSPEELKNALYNIASQRAAAAEGDEIAALKAQDGTLSREAAVGAVLTQIFATIAGAAIGGTNGALVGLGAGAVGGGTIVKEEADKQARLAKQYGLQAKQARSDASKAEAGATKAQMQGFSQQNQREMQDRGFQNQANRDILTGNTKEDKDRRALLLAGGKRANDITSDRDERAFEASDEALGLDTAQFDNMINRVENITGANAEILAKEGTSTETGLAAFKTLVKDTVGEVLPSTELGQIMSAKQGSVPEVMRMLGEKLSKTTKEDMRYVMDQINASKGTTPEQFLIGLQKMKDIGVVRAIEKIEKANKRALEAGATGEVTDTWAWLKSRGYSQIPTLSYSDGKLYLKPEQVTFKNSQGEWRTAFGENVYKLK